MAFEIQEYDAMRLRQCCGLSEFDDQGNVNPIPQSVLDLFEKFYRVFRRGGGTVVDSDSYAIIVALAGEGQPKACDVVRPNIATMWFKKELTYGDPVVVKWRGEDRKAKIVSAAVNRKNVTVQMEGDSEERKVPEDTVSLPQHQEAEL